MNAVMHLIIDRQREAQERGVLNCWTIYDKPIDYPHGYVARRFEFDQPTNDTFTGPLDQIRKAFERCGLYRITRRDEDHPNVVETWL
jgi:hypothetical protein